jgi:hypothetical protein
MAKRLKRLNGERERHERSDWAGSRTIAMTRLLYTATYT